MPGTQDDGDDLQETWAELHPDNQVAVSARAGVPWEPTNALFLIVKAVAYNWGLYSRVRARLRAGTLPLRLGAVFLSRRNLTVPVSDYEPISTDEVCFCIDHELTNDDDSYAGEAALDVTGHNLA